jgi:hypothetical protein
MNSDRFSQEFFSFHSKRFPFSQDMTISTRYGGIKPKYAPFKFLQSIISVLFWFCIACFEVATLLDLCMLFSLPCTIS